MTSLEVITNSEAETIQLGEKVAANLRDNLMHKCIVILLEGELGAGKTQFTKGLAKELGVEQKIVSPTYTYIRPYPMGKHEFVHVDAWRIETKQDFESTGINNYFKVGNLVVIEWPKNFIQITTDMQVVSVKITELAEESRKFMIN